MKLKSPSIYLQLLLVMAVMACALPARAFAPDTYASHSVLSQGKWVKISVTETGLHLITNSQLSSWGFANPASVRIYGSGAAPIPDVLTAENFVDDLAPVQFERTSTGLVFYAVGPVQWADDGKGYLTHSTNAFTTKGYYYLTQSDDEAPAMTQTGTPEDAGAMACTIGLVPLLHEQDLTSPGQTGRLMVGEDFNYTRTRTFRFNTPDATANVAQVRCSFLARSVTSKSTVALSANSEALNTFQVGLTTNDAEYYGQLINVATTFTPSGATTDIGLTFNCPGTVTAANLDFLEVVYERDLAMSGGKADFYTSATYPKVAGADRVWDVTDPAAIKAVNHTGGAWAKTESGLRHYVAWTPGATMPHPVYAGAVANQDLHALSTPDMVIVTPRAFRFQAEKIADMHRHSATDPLTVEVLELDRVLNEFGSGSFDPGALRRCLKMLYDRGAAEGTPLRFALMLGKGTFDNRALTGVGKSLPNALPLWESVGSLSDNSSYTTDDIFAMLDDGSGARMGQDRLCIAVGRIPCTSVTEANVAVEKLTQYAENMPRTDWRNHVLMLADDENGGIHMQQTDNLHEGMLTNGAGARFLCTKIYIDAYTPMDGTYPKAREELYRALDNGVMLWTYIGHGSPNSLSHEHMVTTTDVNTRFYLRHYPFFYAATCSFLKWDTNNPSSAEVLAFMRDGGLIGTISAVRPVYIAYNGDMSKAFGRKLTATDASGRFYTVGEILQQTKNELREENKLRFVLLGDPAMRLAMPSTALELTAVNGTAVNSANPATVKAREQVELTGVVRRPDGEIDTDFSGTITAALYDAEYSVTSHGWGEGEEHTFERYGSLLFSAGGPVENGEFAVKVQMPADIADNYRPATLVLYAHTDDGRDAAGASRSLYAYGYDDTTPEDGEAPVIHTMVLNHESFRDGDHVNADPVLMATVSDNAGINMSSAGIGRQMAMQLDGKVAYSDVAQFYTPDAIPFSGNASGTIVYPLTGLSAGDHELRLRVWDVDGNVTDRTIAFNVVPGMAPEIFDVYTDTNPASVQTNFYVKHNRPDQRMTVTVTVYNLLGQPVWSSTSTTRSDLTTTAPLTWNLTDTAGRRVGRGIYLYRAAISTDDEEFVTASRKIAVTAGQ